MRKDVEKAPGMKRNVNNTRRAGSRSINANSRTWLSAAIVSSRLNQIAQMPFGACCDINRLGRKPGKRARTKMAGRSAVVACTRGDALGIYAWRRSRRRKTFGRADDAAELRPR